MNDFIQSLARLDPVWVYLVIFFISYIENIFPPSPSDTIVVFGGALAAVGHGNFFLALLAGVTGSTLGFMTMYAVGKWFGKTILDTGKIKFLPVEQVTKIEGWFAKYGDLIIVANRFLSGTRAVVSFFAGLSKLDILKTTVLSFISSLVWYGILVYAGYALGQHWEKIYSYLTTYTEVVTAIIVIMAAIVLVRYFINKNSSR